jgi:hypothetical protein
VVLDDGDVELKMKDKEGHDLLGAYTQFLPIAASCRVLI